jgi:SAM-dependent methyltransferase
MRNYEKINEHLDELMNDIYNQPVDDGHTSWAFTAIDKMMPDTKVESVLDVGCGEGFCAPIFEERGIPWTGITLGESDFKVAHALGYNVLKGDFTFLDSFDDNSFHMIFARHALEHSPMPIISLMEWHRVSSKWLLLVAPAPDYWTYFGRNHYSVMNQKQLWGMLKRSGWMVVSSETLVTTDDDFLYYYVKEFKSVHGRIEFPDRKRDVEYRYLCTKVNPRRE